MLKRIIKILLYFIAGLLVIIAALVIYVRSVSITEPPVVENSADDIPEAAQMDSGLYKIGRNWFRKSESGLYELYVEGKPFERGVINGRLTAQLVRYQEEVFNNQIHQLVPSEYYLHLLKYFIGYFNRDLDQYVPVEYQQEIYGVSLAASEDFNNIAQPYQRILNYHAAHDIGHALQNMSLVGCTSFAAWGDASEDGSLLVGRNFDFYVGDDFARDKIIAFINPDKGYKFMMVTFGGMTGVLSGMNEHGLTVTINAAKSDIPGSAATPVSLVAREILQYSSTIQEAYEIVKKRKMFVAESFLIGSAKDGKAALIEKDPETEDLFLSGGSYIISTNHFQGSKLGQTELNKEHMRTSASPYRYERVRELVEQYKPLSVNETASILRNQKGLRNADLGMGNEKLINQLVAHHGIIFQPEKRLVWISTAPWQLGKFVCYDLNKVFSVDMKSNEEVYELDKTIPADSFLTTTAYRQYVKFSRYRFPFNPKDGLNADSVTQWNPNSYHAWMLAGDKLMEEEEFEKAAAMYEKGLALEVATLQEKEHMQKNLEQCKERVK
jgi:isopenicillin-N N-acyltransferase like protein